MPGEKREDDLTGKRILVVEDEASVRLTLCANLELEAFEVLEAESAERALEILAHESVDLVLSDVRMPGMNGIELSRELRRAHPDLPVVLMTAYTSEESVGEAIRAGVFTVLAKPCEMVAVVAAVTRAMRHPSVLVVDRAPEIAEAIARGLRRVGLTVETAYDAEQALSQLRSSVVDVCITELDLPGASGAELVKRLQAAAPAMTLIVCSARDAPELGVVAQAGAYCMSKPLDPAGLARVIAEARSQ